jgi:hypothetical protein
MCIWVGGSVGCVVTIPKMTQLRTEIEIPKKKIEEPGADGFESMYQEGGLTSSALTSVT